MFVEVQSPCWGTQVGRGYDADQYVKELLSSTQHLQEAKGAKVEAPQELE